jgi:hypothetical protein
VRRVSRRIAVPTVNVTAIEQRSEPDGEPSRAHFLPCPEALLLDNACLLINEELKRYRVTGEVTISVSVVVRARSKKHAREPAQSRQTPNVSNPN